MQKLSIPEPAFSETLYLNPLSARWVNCPGGFYQVLCVSFIQFCLSESCRDPSSVRWDCPVIPELGTHSPPRTSCGAAEVTGCIATDCSFLVRMGLSRAQPLPPASRGLSLQGAGEAAPPPRGRRHPGHSLPGPRLQSRAGGPGVVLQTQLLDRIGLSGVRPLQEQPFLVSAQLGGCGYAQGSAHLVQT